jgi:hypothetical protein
MRGFVPAFCAPDGILPSGVLSRRSFAVLIGIEDLPGWACFGNPLDIAPVTDSKAG